MVSRLLRSTLLGTFAAASALTAVSEAANPAHASAVLTMTEVEAGGGPGGPQRFQVLAYSIDFSEAMYLKSKNGTMVAVTDLFGNKKVGMSTVAKSILTGQGSVQVTCPFGTLNADDQFTSGPNPSSVYLGVPTLEPVSSFILSMDGVSLNETAEPNRINIIHIVGSPGNPPPSNDVLKQCKVTFPTVANLDHESVVVNGAGETVAAGDVTFTRVEPQTCDYQKFKEFRKVWKSVLDTALDLGSKDAINSLDSKFMAVLTRTGFNDCFEKLKTFFVVADADLTLQGFKDCPHRWNETDPVWLADPCCNWRLSETVCCAPKPVTIQVPTLQSTESTIINGACSAPAKIGPILLDYVDVQRKQALVAEENYNDLWNTLTRFNSDCQNKVFNTDCTDDTQCPYTGECDVGRSKCLVPYDSMASALTKCYVREMDADLKSEFKVALGLKAIFASEADEEKAFYAKLWEKATSFDCEGPDSQNHRSSRTWAEDANGDWFETVTPGNETSCLSKKLCNRYQQWDAYTLSDQGQTCPAGSPSNICTDCRGDFCNPLTESPECSTYSMTSSECSAASGTYQYGKCKLTPTTKDTCLTNAYCRNATNWQRECSSQSCIITTVTDQTACSQWRKDQQAAGNWEWSWWNKAQNACMVWKSSKTTCEAGGHQYWAGRDFKPGKYDTSAKCDEGLCTHPELRWSQIQPTKDECEKSQFCTTPCRGCESKGTYSQVCVNSTITTNSACSTAKGKWVSAVGSASALCLVDGFNYDKESCEAAGHTHYSCGDQASQGTCGSSPAESALTCYWSNHAQCRDKDHCESSGYCTDFELANSCEWNQCSDTGICLKPFDANRNCDYANGESWGQGGCIIRAFNKATCDSNGHKWVERATNRSSCLGSVTMCKDADMGGWHSLKNETECVKCGGTMDAIYNWVEPKWVNATVKNLTWSTVEAKPVNRWLRTLDYGKFHSMLDGVISSIIARKKYNSFAKKYNPLIVLLDRVACDCGVGGSDCFATVEAVELEKCRIDPGASSSCGGLTIDTSSGSNSTNATSFTLTVNEVPASQLAGSGGGKRSVQFSRASSSDYAVVQKFGQTVGQLVGNGKGFSCGSTCGTAAIEVCFDKNPSIPQDTSSYPTLDIAPEGSTSGSVGEPMEISVTTKNGGLQYCASLTNAGTYYPILRKATLPTSTTPEASPSSSPGVTDPSSAMTHAAPSSWMPWVSIAVAFWTMLLA